LPRVYNCRRDLFWVAEVATAYDTSVRADVAPALLFPLSCCSMSTEEPFSVVRITGALESQPSCVQPIPNASVPVLAANSLVKREVFSLPDPIAVVSVDSDQTYTTNAIKRTLSPAWNQHFDVSVFFPA
jgi:Ca2+-dependent lipid-binding protein